MRVPVPVPVLALVVCLGCQAKAPIVPGNEKMELLGSPAGDPAFSELVDGEDVKLAYGAQGGFHVWMKLKVSGVAPGEVTMVREAHRLDDGKPVLRPPPGTLDVGDAGEDGAWEQPMPMPMFMCPSPIGVRVIDVPVVFSIALSEGDRPLAHAQVTVVPRCPVDAGSFCESICSG